MSTRYVLGSWMGCCLFIIKAGSQIPFKVLHTDTGSLLFKVLFCHCWLSIGGFLLAFLDGVDLLLGWCSPKDI